MKLAAWLLLLAQASPGEIAQASPGEILADPRYQFCHDDRYPLRADERAWCDLAGEDNARCPRFPAACKAGVEADAEADSGAPMKRRAPEGEDARKAKRKPVEIPTGLSGLAQVLFFLLIAAGVAALIWVFFRDRVGARAPEEPEPPPPDEGAPEEEPARVVLTDVERLLAEARRAADADRYEDAIELAYAAALRRLDGDGLIDMHHSRTNGDYLRSLRAHPDLAAHLRDVVRDVERVQFGASAATRSLFDSVLARVLPVATRAAAILMLLLGVGCEPGGDAGEVIGGGFAPSGTRGLIALLEREGVEAGYRLEQLAKVDATTGVLLVLPGGGPEDDDWSGVKRWVEEGGLLVLAGESPDDPELALVYGSPSSETTLTPAPAWAWDLEGLSFRAPGGPTLAPTIGGRAATIALVRGTSRAHDPDSLDVEAAPEGVYAIEQARGQGLVIALADAELFTNVSLAVADNAEAALFLLEPLDDGHGEVEICTLLTGAGAETPMASIHRARLTPFLLQLFAMLGLWMLYRGVHFGTPRDPETHRRRAFADHVRALGLQYVRARAAGRAAGAYAHWAIEQLRDRLPRGRHGDLDALARQAAARAGDPPEEVARLLAAAQLTSDTEGPPSTARHPGLTGQAPFANEEARVDIVRRLARLLARTGHGRPLR